MQIFSKPNTILWGEWGMTELNAIIEDMKVLKKYYNNARLVDPLLKRVINSDGTHSSIFETEPNAEPCYQFWATGRVCANCISLKAALNNATFAKFEGWGDKIYMITALPIRLDDRTVVLELLKNVTNQDILLTLMGTVSTLTDINQKEQMKAISPRYEKHLEDLVRQKTEALEKANKQLQKYRILAEHAKDIMLFINMDGRIIEANEAAVRTYGYTKEELISMTVGDLRESSTKRQIAAQMALADKEGIVFETVHKCKDGRLLYVEVSSQGTTIGNERVLLSIVRDISDRKQAEEQLKHMATHDWLTGIPNRHYLEKYLEETVQNAKKETTGALLFLDIDNFKVINDTFGHAAGDKVLVDLTKKLKAIIRKNDFLARLGGDEFAIVLRGVSVEGAKRVAKKILATLNEVEFAVDLIGNHCKVSVSIGITIIDKLTDTQKLLAYADVALYRAKEEGKNRAVSIENCDEKIRLFETHSTVKKINDSLRDNRLVLHYQPIMSEAGISHYEALLRILDSDGRIIYPNEFIPTAERFGLMSQIDRWVINVAMEALMKNPELSIFVNLSPSSVGDDELLDFIEFGLFNKGIKPERIGFEITEIAAVKDLIKAQHWISHLKKFGCKFALDDFGVGFSSFTHIQMLPVDYIKIDGSFIRNLDSDLTQKALVQAINTVAHTLGKKTIAEFVETEMIWRTLKEFGIDFGQGYFFGRPRPIDDILKISFSCVNE